MFEHTLRETNADEHVVIYELATSQTPEGKDFWLYLAIKPTKYEEYKKLCASKSSSNQSITFTDFGEVILTGWGRTPSNEVKKYMEEKFGMSHSFEQDVENAINELHKSGT